MARLLSYSYGGNLAAELEAQVHLYRMAYQAPREPVRRRATFVADCPFSALRFAGDFTTKIGAELLALNQERPAEINDEFRLSGDGRG